MSQPIETSVTVEAHGIAVTIAGNAESNAADTLASLFGDIHVRAASEHRDVLVDLRALKFATSSCLRVFADWVLSVTESSAPYRIVFLSSPKHSWQRRSLGALVTASNGGVELRAEA
jgi:hypothetical protein